MNNIPDVGKVSTMQMHSINDEIRSTMSNIVENFFYIGEQLKYIKNNKLFKVSKYKNFIEYCKGEFGISKNQAYNFIAVYDRFSDDKYKKFSYSSLVEMLSLSQEYVDEVGEETTIKEIREIKKKANEPKNIEKVQVTEVLEGQVIVEDILKPKVLQAIKVVEVREPIYEKVKEVKPASKTKVQEVQAKQQEPETIETVEEIKETIVTEVIEESSQIKADTNIKSTLNECQVKLLKFFLDKYFINFSVDYQEKFNNSKKLKELFGKENIDICTEMGEIKQALEEAL